MHMNAEKMGQNYTPITQTDRDSNSLVLFSTNPLWVTWASL